MDDMRRQVNAQQYKPEEDSDPAKESAMLQSRVKKLRRCVLTIELQNSHSILGSYEDVVLGRHAFCSRGVGAWRAERTFKLGVCNEYFDYSSHDMSSGGEIVCEQAHQFVLAKWASRERASEGASSARRGFAARSRVLARLASLSQIGELARKLTTTTEKLNKNKDEG